ncbi:MULTISPECIES: HepT-like ribonuclease domain-containing protein [Paraburkholderia]|uniref:Uncharacterized protein n=3 Tax=Paraburkholderia TaxID=1822464 RepID=A0ABU9SMY6_9BURK|nr:DUF86 domain-containing protein [Paraburkholderia nodosa]
MDDDLQYLKEMKHRLRRIREYTREGRRAFMASNMMQDAVVRNIEMIGYTWTCLSPEYRLRLPDFPWRLIGARVDYLMHQRNPERLRKLVWLAVRRSVPELERAMRKHVPEIDGMPVDRGALPGPRPDLKAVAQRDERAA